MQLSKPRMYSVGVPHKLAEQRAVQLGNVRITMRVKTPKGKRKPHQWWRAEFPDSTVIAGYFRADLQRAITEWAERARIAADANLATYSVSAHPEWWRGSLTKRPHD